MTPIELDIQKIDNISKQKEQENLKFRTFLKGQDDVKLDRIVHRLNKCVESQIDCTDCGNCCKNLRPCVNSMEIDTLKSIDKVSREYFVENFIEQNELEDIKFLKGTPCKYLIDKKCSIYDVRPNDCKSYPHINKKKFNSRTWGIIENYAICPIVFNVIERLKTELRFR
ncbi:YkgJ family cysteine cluster protein [Aureibaculum algae]|uniref:YkgJ family cysteine cluster protein n=1 Tax=Aureibaculum algae TaxID=2584122 RepID=A0A5B7TSM7_9FLAO|nr:YkgJ family cysteine cluster protein [Aureibaculum algae]QCX39064.1 YkgJ family cysteine cluster protein [Aureibaculum algae]QCX39899.1 YkgJ family cysteine cluster protein [Aureibaculum algae]